MKLLKVFATGILLLMCSCATFEVQFSDGTNVKTTGAPLLNRTDKFAVVHEWLDATTNNLHQVRVERNTDENADNQYKAVERLAQIIEKLTLQPQP
ncbi:MAG: hypothetical protein N2246_08895 [Candidatus Sumerlaeia bacterium]|nr:hypothetical protein [Candidatus Sumerlaeia bacterium]